LAACIENLVTFGRVVREICDGQTDRQMNRQTITYLVKDVNVDVIIVFWESNVAVTICRNCVSVHLHISIHLYVNNNKKAVLSQRVPHDAPTKVNTQRTATPPPKIT